MKEYLCDATWYPGLGVPLKCLGVCASMLGVGFRASVGVFVLVVSPLGVHSHREDKTPEIRVGLT